MGAPTSGEAAALRPPSDEPYVNEGGSMVGSYVGRPAAAAGTLLMGKVVSYDVARRTYAVVYEDGHREDLHHWQLLEILKGGGDGGSGMKMSCRKRKLDILASSAVGEVSTPPNTRPKMESTEDVSGTVESDVSDDIDSSSNSHDPAVASASEALLQFWVPELPPSSGDIGIPEELISHLFSVYSFLRSFSVQLFLSPFGMDEFVGSLNCTVQNTLLDAVHVSLLRALKRHMQMLSSEGSELASKCLRCHDWTLLDALTWPAFLLEYLLVMGYLKYLGGQGLTISFSNNEYYGFPVSVKLNILQILCDNVIDSAELRTELETREDFDEEMEYDVDATLLMESEQRISRSRNSRTNTGKNTASLQNMDEPIKHLPGPNPINEVADSSDVGEDGNSDECRLCGMDGVLLCCDGCPSAYHSRCIGLNKAFLPDGLWFCPECAVNKLGPKSSRIERGARGAEIFGVDVCGRLFSGTCNYLLVIGTSIDAEPYTRYYNQDDVAKVLNVLCSIEQIQTIYADICRKLYEYWVNPSSRLQTSKVGIPSNPSSYTDAAKCYAPPSSILVKSSNFIKNAGTTDCSVEQPGFNLVEHPEFSDKQAYNVINNGVFIKKELDTANETLSSRKGAQCSYNSINNGVLIKKELETLNGTLFPRKGEQRLSGIVTNEVHEVFFEQKLTPRLGLPDLSTCSSGIENGVSREDACSSIISTKADSLGFHGESRHSDQCRSGSSRSLTKPLPFKPQAYLNQYIHGDIAASAAANLAVMTSEESKVSESRASSNPRKTALADVALQMKAFSSAALHFLWPCSEKKLMEVPRERCGWCIACKGAAVNKKGCLLNIAASNAIKASARNASSQRSLKHGSSHLPTIAAHIATMEESLHGMVVGPFLDAEYRQWWHKQIREASTCRILRFLLLELERNIRGIVFFGGWFKLIDDWSVESFATVVGATRIGTNQKRGAGGRRGRKRALASESAVVSTNDGWKKVQWRRGGKLSKVVLHRWILACSLIRKAARQGGSKRIAGVSYTESSEYPRRSRQFAWRASVEMSNTTSHLALQVRYVDAHIRWRDLFPPDQIPSDGRGSDADASAFRNAVISDKRTVENRMLYALKFSNQKHLPVRVTKNVVEAENIEDGNGKLWFSENHVPLHLIKEFEEKARLKKPLPCSGMLSPRLLPKSNRRQVKPYDRDIFLYLLHKIDQPTKFSCASCKLNVSLRDSVSCSSCQGKCHEDCTSCSNSGEGKSLGPIFTCKSCSAKIAAQNASCKTIQSSQLPQQIKDQMATGTKLVFRLGSRQSPQSVNKVQAKPEKKPLSNASNSKLNNKSSGASLYGLIWKKKNKNAESENNFRLDNIVFKTKYGMNSSIQPKCCLCQKPYRSDLMYICCETCLNWFHADAVQLEEARVFELVGFKCNKCRRKASPKCPYADPGCKKPDSEFQSIGNANQMTESNILNLSKSNIPISPSCEEDLAIRVDDPLLSSSGRVEPIAEQTFEADFEQNTTRSMSQGHQKLSVRRPNVKQMSDPEVEYVDYANASGGSSPKLEWDFSQGDDCYAGVSANDSESAGVNFHWYGPDCGNIQGEEYEPQTYFSFTELLASEDLQLYNPDDRPVDVVDDGYENGSGNMPLASTGPVLDRVVCQKCRIQQPPPNLRCELCGLQIHSHCSPWEESEEPSDEAKWQCGGCREWR